MLYDYVWKIGIREKGVFIICSVQISELIWEQPAF